MTASRFILILFFILFGCLWVRPAEAYLNIDFDRIIGNPVNQITGSQVLDFEERDYEKFERIDPASVIEEVTPADPRITLRRGFGLLGITDIPLPQPSPLAVAIFIISLVGMIAYTRISYLQSLGYWRKQVQPRNPVS